MSNPIDLSKYAKGAKLRCIVGWQCQLTIGSLYTALESDGSFVRVANDIGGTGAYAINRFVPVEDEAPEFKTGDRVRVVKRPHGNWCAEMHVGREFTISDIRPTNPSEGPGAYDESGHNYILLHCIEPVRSAPVAAHPVAANPKPPLGSPPYDNPRVFTPDRQVRVWDVDKYSGLDASTYQQLSTLDKRIAVARAELDLGTAERMKRMAGPGHPPESRSCRVYRSNDR